MSPRGIKGSGPYSRQPKAASTSAVAPADAGTTNTPKRLGWIMWWTIHQSTTYSLEDLRNSARRHALPDWIVDKVAGRQPESAWTVATQLGARGQQSATHTGDPNGSRSRYLTRDIEEDVRAIVRETVDGHNVKVGSKQIAVLTRGQRGKIDVDWAHDATAQERTEVQRLLAGMEDKVSQLVGNMDDARIRQIVLEWLNRNYRICLRGTGGVYFIPRPGADAQAQTLESEIAGMRGWITDSPVCGTFSYAQITDSAGTTVEDFVTAAIDDITEAVTEVNSKLDEYTSNSNMNAGSLMFSAAEMAKRLDGVRAKMNALQEALGEKVGVLDEMLRLVEKRAGTLVRESTQAVERDRLSRQASKKAQAPMVDGQAQQPAGKAGTAKARAAAKKIE